ncbi:hypothetical protein [Caballeronia ptereochthonis]|uniref:hypothetical protein n=1 Tax=Caballeronia ptereochthonis TaxID=1777144 RepID=UPI00117EEB73|nr:hypothetical protein [Caballeronia ptereochthonis]
MSSIAAQVAKDDSRCGRNPSISGSVPMRNASACTESSGNASDCGLTSTIDKINFAPALMGERGILITGGLIAKITQSTLIAIVSNRRSGHMTDG